MTTPPPEEVELDEILDHYNHLQGHKTWVKGKGVLDARAEAKQALLRWRETYAEKLVKEAYKKGYVDGGINK